MSYLLKFIILFISLPFLAEDEIVYEIGNELESSKHFSLVLYHYKKDAIRVMIFRDFNDLPMYGVVDGRDLYKVKKGERIRLMESFRDGKIYKVKLIKERPKRSFYFIETESLKNYTLLSPRPPSS